MVLHGNRLEDLRDLLVQFLRSQPLGPLEAETILVQSNGMKQWLEMALADDAALGVCAATRLELPGSYLWQIYRQVLGVAAVPLELPFDKSRLLWRLVRLLPTLAATQPVYAPLQRYLENGRDGRRLYQLALQLADVFDGYQSYRADWLEDWAAGRGLLRAHEGPPGVLDAAHAWQAQLWRDIRRDVGDALAESSRASVHRRFMASLRQAAADPAAQAPRGWGLPRRIVVFGISSLSTQTLEALAALGQRNQVLMLVQNPCQYYWGDALDGREPLRQQLRRRQQGKPVDTRAPQSLPPAAHPLLASWGKQGRDYLHLLDEHDGVDRYRALLTRVDAFVDPLADGVWPSQLAQLQSAILNLQPPAHPPLPLAGGDDSITLVTAHSAQREVEVLHDQILAWLDADAALQPRDVMVMVPDMAVFAPHIQAVFGRFAPGQTRQVPYSVADTTPRQSPLAQALGQLLMLPGARATLADWVGLFEVAAVRQRFGLSPADIEQLQDWLALAGVRWGLDAAHRQAWGIPDGVAGLDQNTWAFGLRRLLLGYATGSAQAWQDTLAQPAVGGLDAAVVSRLLQWLDAMHMSLQALAPSQPPAQWVLTLRQLVARFFEATDDAEERLIQRMLAPLDTWLQCCEEAALHAPLPLEVVREHWLSQIEESGRHQRFFGGGVQFGTLMPMRSIPFKVIALLGMNDGAYPRPATPHDFDLMAQSWRPGDRSRREDDRYLFLEALLSARQRLYLSWQGHRATDNTVQPPSVLVAQLLEHLNTGWSPPRRARAQPLQPFSQAYFRQGSDFATYDQDWARVHARTAPVVLPGPSSPAAVAARADAMDLPLDELRRLVRQPVEVFLRSRLGVHFDPVEDAVADEEPFSLDGLARHQIGDALLQSADPALALAQLRLSGQLPMAGFGALQANALAMSLQVVLERRSPWLQGHDRPLPPQTVALDVDGWRITGTLNGLLAPAQDAPAAPARALQLMQRLGAVSEGSKGHARPRVHVLAALWVRHLAGCASGLALTSVQLGLDAQVWLPPLAPDEALAVLRRLVRAYREAWARPLPVGCKTAWAYLQAQAQSHPKSAQDPHEQAEVVFDGGYHSGERSESAYLARAFDTYRDIEAELPHWAQQLYGDLACHARLGQAGEVSA